ncbi:hypothetical protein CEXT_485931 [Caerostris extrusa]|uniref:Uncharacterized protein n=1 Tax=Caerostris extrusa TaxID=172846 RepID=A0AAV4TIH3_CAEEX|nr:hypothetical protein CEXT_485931 [Caerostris extrusa]
MIKRKDGLSLIGRRKDCPLFCNPLFSEHTQLLNSEQEQSVPVIMARRGNRKPKPSPPFSYPIQSQLNPTK